MAKQPKVVTVEHDGSSGPSVYVESVKVETVQSPGLVTLSVGEPERRYLNPKTLPRAPTGFAVVAE